MSSRLASPLFQTLKAGAIELPNRIIMAPMTRLRTLDDLSLPSMAETYYAQRASAGLIITEVVAAAPIGAGYGPMPVFATDAQISSWRNIVDSVHNAGGRLAAQLWHPGRVRGPEIFADDPHPFPAARKPLMPAELSVEELRTMEEDFAAAARSAIAIGFDAVEIHSGNGLIPTNFLRTDTNQRRDDFGGSPANRSRLLLNIARSVSKAIDADRVGVKIAPNSTFAGRYDPGAEETYSYLLPQLADLDLAYIHVNRGAGDAEDTDDAREIPLSWVRDHYKGMIFGAERFGLEDGARAISDGILDAVVYGRPFLANPDLPERFARGLSLNEPDPETFYTGGEKGYIDYQSVQNPD